jgi:hypothetical protein
MSDFQGFDSPNTIPVPQQFFDELMPDLSLGETRVLLYIIRRTYGWGKRVDSISLSQLCNGITRRRGDPLDRGTGLNKETVLIAVRSLLAKNMIEVSRQETDRGHEANIYSLKLRSECSEIPTPLTRKFRPGDGGNSDPPYPEIPTTPYPEIPTTPYPEDPTTPYPEDPTTPYPEIPAIQQTDLQQTDLQKTTNNKQETTPYSPPRGTGRRSEKKTQTRQHDRA